MNLNNAADVAEALKRAEYPTASHWLLAQAAQFIIDELTPRTTRVTFQQVRSATQVLNDYCHYDLTEVIARTWLDCQGFDATVQRRRAQALINTHRLDEAEQVVTEGIRCNASAVSTSATASREVGEYWGLLGRIDKQRFVNTGDLDALCKATNQYLIEYERTKEGYPGINALACLMLEKKENAPRRDISMSLLATAILDAATSAYSRMPQSWDAAIASEASLALDHCDDAELWLYRFLAHEKSHPFNIDSYARQLREVWGGNPLVATNCADRLSGIISRHIGSAQSRLTIAPSQILGIRAALESDTVGLEKNFLGESSFTVDALRSLLQAFASIACVMNKKGERLGTGFLVRGSWLTPDFGDAPVLVTNAHVISDTVAKAISLEDARVMFELDAAVGNQQRQYQVTKLLYSSPPGYIGVPNADGTELDCTIVRLDGLPSDVKSLAATEQLPLISPRSKAFVAGHPRGAGLQIALHDSQLLDIDDHSQLVHYRTPTEPGSSGSPVFNSKWEVIALHHAGTSTTPRLHGSGTHEANEGISMSAIRRKLNSHGSLRGHG